MTDFFGRTFWNTYSGTLPWRSYSGAEEECKQVPQDKALLVGSRCEDDQHAPVLDIDFPAELVPSTTPGHFHLYMNKKMSWHKYKNLLDALLYADIIEAEFYNLCIKRGQSMVLLPGMKKLGDTEEKAFYR